MRMQHGTTRLPPERARSAGEGPAANRDSGTPCWGAVSCIKILSTCCALLHRIRRRCRDRPLCARAACRPVWAVERARATAGHVGEQFYTKGWREHHERACFGVTRRQRLLLALAGRVKRVATQRVDPVLCPLRAQPPGVQRPARRGCNTPAFYCAAARPGLRAVAQPGRAPVPPGRGPARLKGPPPLS